MGAASLTDRRSGVYAVRLAPGPSARFPAIPSANMHDRIDFPVVDTHQHLWDLDRFRLPWITGNQQLGRSFRMPDYLEAAAGLKLAQTVYMEVDLEPAQQADEARWAVEQCRREDNPMAAAVVSGRPASAEFAACLRWLKGYPEIKGLRQILHGPSTPAGYCLDPAFVRGIQRLGDAGLSFDLCLRSSELLDADKLVAQCPRTRFIVDHCGNMNVQDTEPSHLEIWKNGMRHLADHDHVVCKVSGIVATAAEGWTAEQLAPIVRFTIDTFGPDRVMFAGDWPVCTPRASLRQWIEALAEITRDRSDADWKKLLHDNAVRFYGLRPAGAWEAKSERTED